MLSNIIAFLARRLADRGAVERLSRMSDHELKDIGLMRHEIEDAVRGRATA